MEQLWAPWRLAYVQEAGAAEGCVFCREAAGELGEASLVVHRGERAFVLLNKFPYSSGHLMVAPVRHIPALGDLDEDESAEIHALTVQAVATLRTAYAPEGFNVGWNLGDGGGRIHLGPPARARRAALGRRHELHARARRHQGAARAPRSHPCSTHGALGERDPRARRESQRPPAARRGTRARARPGRALHRLPRQRHRASQRHGAAGQAWPGRGGRSGRGDSRTAPRPRSRRQRVGARRVVDACRPRSSSSPSLGILPDEDEPVAIGMVLTARRRDAASRPEPPRVGWSRSTSS